VALSDFPYSERESPFPTSLAETLLCSSFGRGSRRSTVFVDGSAHSPLFSLRVNSPLSPKPRFDSFLCHYMPT